MAIEKTGPGVVQSGGAPVAGSDAIEGPTADQLQALQDLARSGHVPLQDLRAGAENPHVSDEQRRGIEAGVANMRQLVGGSLEGDAAASLAWLTSSPAFARAREDLGLG